MEPFQYLFNKFWSDKQKVTILGYEEPKFKLEDNFNFISLGKQTTTIKEVNWGFDKKADTAISDENNLYISWAFFEEEVLNDVLGFQKSPSGFGGHFEAGDIFMGLNTPIDYNNRVGFRCVRTVGVR